MGVVDYGSEKKSPTTPSEYTDKQYKALDKLKQLDPPLKLGAARAEFANKILLVDGTLSSDLDAMRAAVAAEQAEDRTTLRAFQTEHTQAILDDTLAPELKPRYTDLRTWGNHDWLAEVDDSIAQGRFLFVVDARMTPRIYFQCAVPGNPDVELADPIPATE